MSRGEVLFMVDPAPYKAAYDIAMANVSSAEAAVSNARLVYDSNRQLYEEKVVSEFELNNAKNELDQANARLRLAHAELDKAATNLSYIHRPADTGMRHLHRHSAPGADFADQPSH